MRSVKETAFTVELLGLFILLIMVITIISSVFVTSRAHSLQAKQLTEAVILAESAAEVSSSAPDNEALFEALSAMDNCKGLKTVAVASEDPDGTKVMTFASPKKYDASSGENIYVLSVTRSYPDGTVSERSEGGAYASDLIEVYLSDGTGTDLQDASDKTSQTDPVYKLETGTYFASDKNSGKGGES